MQEIQGFIKLFRKFKNWEWYSNIAVKTLFLHLLISASYKDFRWQGNEYKAGQIIVGRKKLSEETGLSESQVRSALEKLSKSGEIVIKTTNKFSVITIAKWQDYQVMDYAATNKSQTDDQPSSTKSPHNKNIKNKKKSKNNFACYDLSLLDQIINA